MQSAFRTHPLSSTRSTWIHNPSALGVPSLRVIVRSQRLRAVWGTSSNDVFIAGDGGTILRYDGVRWSAQSVPTSRDLRAIWGRGPTEIYAAGDSGTVLRYDGTSWRSLTTSSTSIIYSLFGIGTSGAVAAVGEIARVLEGQP